MEPNPQDDYGIVPDAVPGWMIWCDREIRHQPFVALSVAAAAGFLLGGGLKSRVGRGMVLFAGRSVIRSAVLGFIAGLVEIEDDDDRYHDPASRRFE
jgi:hypothetical protein